MSNQGISAVGLDKSRLVNRPSRALGLAFDRHFGLTKPGGAHPGPLKT